MPIFVQSTQLANSKVGKEPKSPDYLGSEVLFILYFGYSGITQETIVSLNSCN